MNRAELLLLPQSERLEFAGNSFNLEYYPDFVNSVPNQETRQRIAAELTPLTAEGFMRFGISDELIDDVKNHVAEAPRLLILKDDHYQPVLYLASGTGETPIGNVYYLGGIIVAETLQGQKDESGMSISEAILRAEISTTNTDLLAFHTQSEKMRGLGRKVSDLDIALAISLLAYFPPKEGTIMDGDVNRCRYNRGAGTQAQCLYDDVERFEKIAIKEPGFDWLHGDAKFVAGYLR